MSHPDELRRLAKYVRDAGLSPATLLWSLRRRLCPVRLTTLLRLLILNAGMSEAKHMDPADFASHLEATADALEGQGVTVE
ncbi:MAG TPA: hypothetical protein PLQ23_15125 [Dermatophilaceae bacterium]|nr:hypothetical protein [Dermatophilaceae bacterium]